MPTIDAPLITSSDIARSTAIGVAISFGATVVALAIAQPAAMDFIAHYAAASLVLAGQGPAILDPAAVTAAEHAIAPEREQLLPYVRPPAFALLMAPLALLPFTSAFLVTAVLDAVIIAVSLWLLWPQGRRVLGVPLVLLAAPPSAVAIAHAQMSPLMLLLVALSMRLGPRGSGLALGLSLLRPQTAPLLLLAGASDRSRLPWTIAGALAVGGASAAVVGVDGLIRYVGVLAAGSSYALTGEFGQHISLGWPGLALWLGAGPLGIVAAMLSLAAGAILTVRSAPAQRPAVAALWSLLAGPVLIHDAVLAYPALLLVSTRQRLWDVGSVVAWLGHILIAPAGVVWSCVLAAVAFVGGQPDQRIRRE